MVHSPSFEKRFFAASNAAHGFHNDYPACFGEGSGVDRLYVIKGGPGTGKSYLMRTLANYATVRGYDAIYYYCSSDPASLDGIRLTKAGCPTVAVVDGTAPHVWEPSRIGTREELINLCAFWDSGLLRSQSERIHELADGKADCYRRAYRYLAACGAVDAAAEALLLPCILQKRITRCASRILRDEPEGKGFSAFPARLRAVGMTGEVTFDTFHRMAEAHPHGRVISVADHYGLAYRLTDVLMQLSQARKMETWVSRDPVHPHKIDGLFYPHTGLCIWVVGDGKDAPTVSLPLQTVTLHRMADPSALREVRTQLRTLRRIHGELMAGARHQLSCAATYHFGLEKIYAGAMDFARKEEHDRALCRDIFGE